MEWLKKFIKDIFEGTSIADIDLMLANLADQKKKEEEKRLRKLKPAFSSGKSKLEIFLGISMAVLVIGWLIGYPLIRSRVHRKIAPPAPPAAVEAVDYKQMVEDQEKRLEELSNNLLDEVQKSNWLIYKLGGVKKQLAEEKKARADLEKSIDEKQQEIGRLSRLEQESRQKIANLEKEKRDLIADYEEKLSKAAQELSSQKASYETQTANLKSQHEKNLAALKAELAKEIEKAMTKIASILEAYATLIEIKAKPLSVKFMEKDISENKGRAVSIEPILGQKMDEGNYISGRNFDLYESYSAAAKQLEKLLNLYINNGGVIGKWGEILKGHKELLRKFQPVK